MGCSLNKYSLKFLLNSWNVNLSLILRKYDANKSLTVNDIKFGEKFIYSSKTFVKVKKLRKRIKCYDEKNKKIYLFNPIAKIGLKKLD